MVDLVLSDGRTLDEAMEAVFDRTADAGPGAPPPLAPRDRAFARLLTATVLRRAASLEAALAAHLTKLPRGEGRAWPILLTGAAQLLLLDTPPHAAISLAVDQTKADRRAHHLAGLVNAVLRKIAGDTAAAAFAARDPVADVPAWLRERWALAYGAEAAHAIALACLTEAPLDLTLRDPDTAAAWATRLGGRVLPWGSVRLVAKGPIEDLDGYGEGAWWVQDAAATLPVRLLGPVAGLRVADLCAAPGGKTAALAAAGARVTAVDASGARLRRVADNLARLKLTAEIVAADVTAWQPDAPFDAVLLDAPCTATGTLRRHPDILRLRTPADVARLAETQARLLAAAARLVRPGGTLVYCTCSLEPEEGPAQIARFLAATPDFARRPVTAPDVAGHGEMVTADGDLRTLPCHLPDPDPRLAGLDGFHATRLHRG
jgi:16S rRNA (cytosine967-C5)-methyltransferase